MCIYIYTKSTILLYVIASRNQKKKVLQVSTLFLVANIGADSLLLPPNHLFTNHKRGRYMSHCVQKKGRDI